MSGVQDPHVANLAKSYRAGWVHAAGVKAMDQRYLDHSDKGMRDEYSRGYEDGTKARKEAMNEAYERLGYKPQILRLAHSAEPKKPEGFQPACRAVKDGEQCEGLDGHAAKHWATIIGAWEPDETDSYDGPILWRDY